MKIRIGNEERECGVHVCTGYRATAMHLDANDLADLARMSDARLIATVHQLANRTAHRPALPDEN